MFDRLLDSLLVLTAAFSGAVLLVMVLREPCRKLAGSKFAYWIWLLVPLALVAVLAPAVPHASSPAVSGSLLIVAEPAQSAGAAHAPSGDLIHRLAGILRDLAPYLLVLWGMGLATFLGGIVLLQRKYMVQLGRLSPDPSSRNVFYSHKVGISPSVVGLLPSRIILPADFSSLFDPNEQRLILAHEHTHVRERHPVAGAVGLVILAVQWCNPLAYMALSLFRIDQELACDAAVVAAHPGARATYAKAMLKACLDPAFGPPLGYCWGGALSLPMPHRISLLRHKPPPPGRRATAMVMLTLIASGSAAAAYLLAPHPQIRLSFSQTVASSTPTPPSRTVAAPEAEAKLSGYRAKPSIPMASASASAAAEAELSSTGPVPALAAQSPGSADVAREPELSDLDDTRRRLYEALAEAAARGENVYPPRLRWVTRDGRTFASVLMGPSLRDPTNFDDLNRITASIN